MVILDNKVCLIFVVTAVLVILVHDVVLDDLLDIVLDTLFALGVYVVV